MVAILSLGSPVVMDFTPHLSLSTSTTNIEDKDSIEGANHENLPNYPSFSVALMPGSLLIFKDTVYSGGSSTLIHMLVIMKSHFHLFSLICHVSCRLLAWYKRL